MKKIVTGLILCMAMTAFADEAAIREAMKTAYPQVKLKSVSKTPFNGLYELFMESGQILYTDEKLSFLIVEGKLIDPKTRQNLTDARLTELNRVDLNSLPLDKAIKVVKGNGSRKLIVFSDPDCPYCVRLEKEGLKNITDVTIYVMLYPLDGLHPDAANKAKAIWCSPDKAQAWQDWMFEKKLPKGIVGCDTPIKSVAEVGRRLGISSTPTLIFSDGMRVPGAIPPDEIEALLNAAKTKK
jgi:thiol:disulfide interchange protein DsbC